MEQATGERTIKSIIEKLHGNKKRNQNMVDPKD